MKIAIRADGGNKIGMGHIMRTLVLAKELAKTNNVFYVCRMDNTFPSKYKQGIEKVKLEGFNVITIDENNTLNQLKSISADCLITDSYDVNEDYFNKTKKLFKVTGYVDDVNLYNFNVDFIINQNIGAEEFSYKVNKDTKLFLGTSYIMLREEFRKVPKRRVNKNVENVMITVGGSDSNGITNIICDYVKDFEFKFHVVVGPSFNEENIERLIKLKNLKNNIILYFNANMIEIMNKCDIAISACGSTLYELAASSIPTIGIIIANNQKIVAGKMHEKGLIYNLGWFTVLTKDKILDNIKEISKLDNRKRMINKQKVINGDGVGILAKGIQQLYMQSINKT
ncbi:UDP-2,4-diacetamido-2,4,6-trideoxy-beta-L-altropyranose hydrolase [Clostridium tetani]|uniref:UDP-2,4-diacetamido-2,4, 6-trideoxy-beta-L-altropyranose hydrolase n=1 Tax=Clostridium tetani TaxID=1513 RepID=UPI00100B1891|nr:UDP-2,4-diacetamido-2,4,6-trideoxy-beta-L-altropyranose hydrolase [Clostridium tetani]RXI45897.1 UDP-2,4-diacetamido-2,4,6-trideoxy-beta-L-altropyranose hydrolase [Clostridium tetani]RXM61289.1 UDP-2,4-diacetamido-2,4,6-trideoxy-beta-L-altropyranose hydrolase [Clostridium tetani]RXM70114.1 UDP-2,4-diacetamido-2,4,6-trideoxy-beta-L-altropyranose hydrolase [Clostridium tetani]